MKLENRDIITLAKKVAGARSTSTSFSFDGKDYSIGAANAALREQFNLLAGDYNSYRRNKNDVFEIMQEVINVSLPKSIMENYGMFAEIKKVPQGSKPSYTRKLSRSRAKQFITRVGLAGIYEVFKLDTMTFDIQTGAFGGAIQIGLEEFLDGTIEFTDMLDILMDGMDEAVYREIALSLAAGVDTLQASNKAGGAGIVKTELDKLINVVRAYGNPVIYGTFSTVSQLVPEAAMVSDNMRDEFNNKGFLGMYKGAKVVALPQSWTDETNTTPVMDNGKIYIFPEGDSGRPVKIALEGDAIIDEYANYDRSKEIQAYQKFGVAFIVDHNMAVYTGTGL